MSEQIFVQRGNERIELTGEALEAFLADRTQMQFEAAVIQAELDAKTTQKFAIFERLGLTEEEIQTILN